jgi:hypothetical protein
VKSERAGRYGGWHGATETRNEMRAVGVRARSSNDRLSRLKDRHAGQRLILVANGPSLNRMDLTLLRGEITLGLNKIFLGFSQFGFYPRYYVAVNEKVIQQSADRIRAMNCVKFIAARSAHLVPEDALTYHISTMSPPARFCTDVAQGVHEGWTVTYVALQIAYFMGFNSVIIVGLDHRYRYTGVPNEAGVLNGPDPNHFSPEYFGFGQTWDNPDLARAEESFHIARERFEAAGRRIFDATVGGACTVFEKGSLEVLLREDGPPRGKK